MQQDIQVEIAEAVTNYSNLRVKIAEHRYARMRDNYPEVQETDILPQGRDGLILMAVQREVARLQQVWFDISNGRPE